MLNGVEKAITIAKIYTRKIDKEYKKLMYKDSTTKSDAEWKIDFRLNPISFDEASDYLVMTMASLNLDEVESLSTADYDKLVKAINEIKDPNGSKWDTK